MMGVNNKTQPGDQHMQRGERQYLPVNIYYHPGGVTQGERAKQGAAEIEREGGGERERTREYCSFVKKKKVSFAQTLNKSVIQEGIN